MLDANNTKDWWKENRGTYDEQLKPAAQFLRMKGAVASRPIAPDAPLLESLNKAFTALWPLNELLISIAEA